jgi:hypothetical protein
VQLADIGPGSNIYDLFLLLHILSAIAGFGGVLLNGAYAARAKALPPAQGLAVMEVNTWVSTRVAEGFILATAVFGFGLVGLSDGVIEFSATWVWLSLLLYIAALGVSHGLLRPKVRQMLGLQREMVDAGPLQGAPPQAQQLGALGKQIGAIAGVLDIALVTILFLMVFKPGWP